jgi:hypothetical protein
MAELQHPGHLGAAEVQVAVGQPQELVGLDAVLHRERRRIGHGEDLDHTNCHLHLAGR